MNVVVIRFLINYLKLMEYYLSVFLRLKILIRKVSFLGKIIFFMILNLSIWLAAAWS